MTGDDADLLPYVESGHITVQPPGRPWRDFLKLLQTARSLFVPNVHDASPRWAASNKIVSSGLLKQGANLLTGQPVAG